MKSFPDTVRELWELLRQYALQELYGPLKSIPAYVGIGLGGAATVAVGVVLVLLGLLRMVQAEGFRHIDASGDSSAIPYLVVFVVCALLAAGLATRIGKSFKEDA